MSDTHKNEVRKIPAHDVTAPQERSMRPLVKKLSEADLALTESLQIFYTATPPVGTTREDMLNPIFWSHVARKLKSLTEIRAMPKDGLWYGVYLVLYADQQQAKLKELSFHSLEVLEEPGTAADPYTVEWISPPVRYGIRRKADKHVMKDGFQTKDQAIAWKMQNL